jgi:hypothetical protein
MKPRDSPVKKTFGIQKKSVLPAGYRGHESGKGGVARNEAGPIVYMDGVRATLGAIPTTLYITLVSVLVGFVIGTLPLR